MPKIGGKRKKNRTHKEYEEDDPEFKIPKCYNYIQHLLLNVEKSTNHG